MRVGRGVTPNPAGRRSARSAPSARSMATSRSRSRVSARLRVVRDDDVLYRRDLGVLCGVLVSTEHLTAATLGG